jgi:hypothetical protein
MRDLLVPAYHLYGEPIITTTTPSLTWRGVAGAFWYTIERSPSGLDGSWVPICEKCTDNDAPWIDKNRPAGTVWYKIEASNLSATGVFSAIQEDPLLLPVSDP